MKIVVCVKASAGEINPFDESALEFALRTSSDVTVVSMGPPAAKSALLPLTRLGAKVILISDPAFAGSDTLATSYVLSEALKRIGFDLIVCGRQSVDGDTAQVGPMLAEMLGVGVITNVFDAECKDGFTKARTRDGREQLSLPCLLTMERGFVLRFPSIFSRAGEVTIWDNSHLGCDTSRTGLRGSPTRVVRSFESERGKRKCEFVPLSRLSELISEIKSAGRAEQKRESGSTERLEKAFAVGRSVLPAAEKIAREVILKEGLTPEELACAAREEKPDVILFPASRAGRRDAPRTAAILETGLCADCTALECSEGELYMYRPALGGSITAKIKCLTRPIMATVRCESDSAGVVVSVGRGAVESMDKAKVLADSLGAELCGSRGAVDMGLVPYEGQVGLTGRSVSPDIYIAIGISGAVHHTVAIEGAGKIIAINPDRNARIFEYADYGIVDKF